MMGRQRRDDRAVEAMLEPLEQRVLLSARLLDSGTLEVFGSRASETIILQEAVGQLGAVRVFGSPGVSDGTVFEGVSKVRLRMRAGDDMARVDGIPLDTEGEVMPIIIFGGADNDELEIVTTDGKLVGGAGRDTLFGGPGENKLVGGPGPDFLAGGGGDDILVGGFARDRLFGESGDDLLRGGPAKDILRGGSGNDTLFGGRNRDDLFGGSGFDRVMGQAGSDIFRGTFFEWEDFGSEDAFFHPRFNENPRDVTLPDAFWADMNAIDSEFGFLIPDRAWKAVDALQHLYGGAPDEVAALQDALELLGDSERTALGEAAQDRFTDFLDGFSRPGDIRQSDLNGLFADLSSLMPGEVRAEFDTVVDVIQGDQALSGDVLRGVRAIATGQFPAEFEALINEFLFGG